jgi:hypothetical protein
MKDIDRIGGLGNSEEGITVESEVAQLARHFIKDVPLGTVRSKAFCDFVDWVELDRGGCNHERYARIGAIDETIRQRRNELPGYKIAMDELHVLFELPETLFSGTVIRRVPSKEIPILLAVKERYISPASF